MKSARYYECHVTIEPLHEDWSIENVKMLAAEYGFKLATLHMQKRPKDSAVRSKYDDFLTTRGKDYEDIVTRTYDFVRMLHANDYKVWRVKIEDTMFDTNLGDLIPRMGCPPITEFMVPRDCAPGDHVTPHRGCVLR